MERVDPIISWWSAGVTSAVATKLALDELDPEAGRRQKIVTPDCGNFCDIEFTEIMHPRVESIYEQPEQLSFMFEEK